MIKLLAFLSVLFTAIMADSVCGSEKVEPAPSATPPREMPSVQGKVPQGILDAILKETATLANVPREKLAIIRAQPVTWNDGSLGCPEPGAMYTQALVNGYWVVIHAADKTYDFRVDNAGRFRLCPAGRGHPPSTSDAT
jgi:hypothetical protein